MNSFSSLFVRAGLLCVAAVAIPVVTGCGVDVGVSGSTGSGGHASGAGGGCSNSPTGSGAGGAETGMGGAETGMGGAETGTGGAETGMGGAETGTGGSGALCGGIGGIPCPATEYCDFPSNSCGFADESGTCKPRPQACDTSYIPTCGCDGQIYGNDCTARGAGHDVAPAGTCMAPGGMFACGQYFCNQKSEYCTRQISDVVGEPDTYVCTALPGACLATPSCACIAGAPCGNACAATSDGGLQVTCPGG